MNQPSSVASRVAGVACGSASVQICHVFDEMLRGRAVEPRRRRRVLHPRVIRAGVVRHHVEDDLDARAVRVVDELPERRDVAEVLVDGVEVDGAVAVIVGDRPGRRRSPSRSAGRCCRRSG